MDTGDLQNPLDGETREHGKPGRLKACNQVLIEPPNVSLVIPQQPNEEIQECAIPRIRFDLISELVDVNLVAEFFDQLSPTYCGLDP